MEKKKKRQNFIKKKKRVSLNKKRLLIIKYIKLIKKEVKLSKELEWKRKANNFAGYISKLGNLGKLRSKNKKLLLRLHLLQGRLKKKSKKELAIIEKKYRMNIRRMKNKLFNKVFFKKFIELKNFLIERQKRKKFLRKIHKLVYKRARKKDKKNYFDALKYIKRRHEVEKLAKNNIGLYKDMISFYKEIILKKTKKKNQKFFFWARKKGYKFYRTHLCIFVIKVVKSNCFVSMMDLNGKLIKTVSGGMAISEKQKKIKKAVYVIYKMIPFFRKELRKFRIRRAFVYLKTGKDGNHANSLIYMLYKNKVRVNNLFLKSNEPHSAGLRKKKLRRL